jgi:hypothetical protein
MAHALVPCFNKLPQIAAVEKPLAINPVMFGGGCRQGKGWNGKRPSDK